MSETPGESTCKDQVAKPKRRVFLSYGHDDYANLAERLRDDLRAKGHEVWFDMDQLAPGVDWEDRIEDGFRWVRESVPAGCVVLLMTPHSVRRPDGYCLNEVARAVDLRLNIIPVMVVWCERPLSIYRIQFLDMQDCVPLAERAQRYAARLDRLLRCVDAGGPLESEGGQARLLAALQPLSFTADIQYHLKHFVGRKWLFERIDSWLADPAAPRLFWITGDPGVGKTAIASWLAAHKREVVAFHLCRHGDSGKADPRRCVMSIAYQMSTQLADYEQRLNQLPLELIVEQSNAETLFDRLIVQPLWQDFPRPDRIIAVLIDALDEATRDGKNELAQFLAGQFAKTPDWLRLIITSRPETEVMTPLAAFSPDPLDTRSAENVADLRDYLRSELAQFCGSPGSAAATLEAIVERSEGSFLYANWIREELAAGRLKLDRPHDFPFGLGGVYASFFARRFAEVDIFKRVVRPALQLVAASREPLPIRLIAERFDWGEQDISDFEQAAGSLFPERDDCIQPFHRSVMEWLTNPNRAGSYFVSERDGNKSLAVFGWALFEKGTLPPYFMRHLAEHLAELGDWARLEQLLSNLDLFERTWDTDGVYAWIGLWRMMDEGRKAGERYRSAIEALEKSGADSAHIARLADRIGGFLRKMEYDADARPFIERALAWREANLGPNHPDVAESLHNLAELFRREKEFEAARPLYERALAIRRAAPAKPDDTDVADILHDLGEFNQDQKQYSEAQRCYEESLGINEHVLPPHDPRIAGCLNDLGTLHFEQGHGDTAWPLYDRAERIYRQAYGPDHPETAATQFNKARIHEDNGEFAKAWPLFLRALEVHERILPPHHHDVFTCRNAFVQIVGKLDDIEGSAAREQLVEARQRAYGGHHPVTAETCEAIAWYSIERNPPKAVDLARRAVIAREKLDGPEHLATATALNTLVRCLQVARRFAEAVPLAQTALAIRERHPDVPAADLASSLNNLGLLKVELGDLAEAEPLLHRCLQANPQAEYADYWLGRLYEKRAAAGDVALEVRSWRDFLTRGIPNPERRAYAERRLRVIEGGSSPET